MYFINAYFMDHAPGLLRAILRHGAVHSVMEYLVWRFVY